MRFVYITFLIIAFLASCFWVYFDFDYPSAISVLVTLASLIGVFVSPKKMKSSGKQIQKGGDKCEMYQAQGDINITRK